MSKLIKNNYMFLIGLLISLSLLWPLGYAPYFTHHDDVQAIRLHQMNKCIQDLQIPCRWVPDLGGLYGYPLFNYYAPLAYYFGEVIFLITGSLIFSAKLMFATSFIGSYVFMYLLGKRIWGKAGGVVSGVFYLLAPYHAVDFYVRGAMGEMWALMFFPAILWALFKTYETKRIKDSLLLGLTISGLVLSHNLSAMIFLPSVIFFAITFFILKVSFRFLKLFILALIIGFLLSAFYALPAYFEKGLVHVETTTYGYFSYTEHFKGLRKLFLDTSWGWGASVREIPGGEKDGLSFQIGWVHLLGWLISLIVAIKLWQKDIKKSLIILLASGGVLISIFMVHPRSEFIWRLIEPLKYIQFPWRFLELIIFFISFITGSIIYYLEKMSKVKMAKATFVLLILVVIAANFLYFRPEKFLDINDYNLLAGPSWEKQIKRSIFDYLPKSAKYPPRDLATKRYEVIVGQPGISELKELSNNIMFTIAAKELTIVRLSQYYFPDWEVKVDGKKVEINPRNELGLITFAVDPGQHKVEAKLQDTPIRTFSNVLTILGFMLFIFLLFTQYKKTRKWMFYYFRKISKE